MRRVRLIVLFVLLVLDVLGNMLCALGAALWRSRSTTLSATAWAQREHRLFGWTHRFIDWMPWFGEGHCRLQWEREQKFGGVWSAWNDQFKG